MLETNIYHIAYTPELKEAEVFFWGCNMECRGCSCKREIYDPMLKENLFDPLKDPPREIAKPPERFLNLKEVMQILSTLEVKRITLAGMEPTIDPQYAQVTKALHERFGTYNLVFTNLYTVPSLEDTDKVEVSVKAITDSLHRDYTGESNKRVLENFVKVYKSGVELLATSIYIPNYIGVDEIDRIAGFIADVDKNIPFVVLPYVKVGDNPWRRPTHAEMDEAVSVAKRHLSEVYGFYGDEELKHDEVTIFPNATDFKKIVERRSNCSSGVLPI